MRCRWTPGRADHRTARSHRGDGRQVRNGGKWDDRQWYQTGPGELPEEALIPRCDPRGGHGPGTDRRFQPVERPRLSRVPGGIRGRAPLLQRPAATAVVARFGPIAETRALSTTAAAAQAWQEQILNQFQSIFALAEAVAHVDSLPRSR